MCQSHQQGTGLNMAIHLSKIYTKTGDKGKTRLVGGQEISKKDLRLECYGTSDELNSIVGVVRTSLEFMEKQAEESHSKRNRPLSGRIQSHPEDLFDLGSYLGYPTG